MPAKALSLEVLGQRMDCLARKLAGGLGLNEACRAAGKELGIPWATIKTNYVKAVKMKAEGHAIVVPAVVEAPLEERLVDQLRRKPMLMEDLAAALGEGAPAINAAMTSLKGQGVNVVCQGHRYSISGNQSPAYVEGPTIEIVSDDNNRFTVGAIGDNHLCSKYERLDVLHDLYDRFESAGVASVFNTGNWIDGEARFNMFDVHTHGVDAQLSYLAANYPSREGMNTFAIAGDDHEGWYAQKFGLDIGRAAERAFEDVGREDWHNLGYMSAHVKLVNANTGAFSILNVMHPGGGSAYAISYTAQKIVEAFEGGEKPAVLFLGHYHKMECANVRNVWTLQTGCTQDQTPFMMKKRLEAHVGGVIVGMEQDPRTGAIIGFTPQMTRYFNKGYYQNRWSHAGPITQPKRAINPKG
jgi:biotin operon repressor